MAARWEIDDEPDGDNAQARRAAPGAPLDPYFRWAEHTEWRGYRRLCGWGDGTRPPSPKAPEERIQLIVQAESEAVLDEVLNPQEGGKPTAPRLRVPAAYREPPMKAGQKALCFTATLAKTADNLAWLRGGPAGLRWKLALPMRDAEKLAKAVPNGLYGETRDAKAMAAKNLLEAALKEVPAKDEADPQQALLALIDFGCPFLNEAFDTNDGTATRVLALWDQGAPPRDDKPGWPWRAATGFERGRMLGPDALRRIVEAARKADRSLEETAVYRGIDYLIDYGDPRRRIRHNTHGGHLLDVLGGSPDPLTHDPAGDAAARARLAFVQLPFEVAMDSSGGSLAPHVLDGVRWAMSLCPPGNPLVVSISYGGQAGPHDGRSIIEEALAELLALRQNNFAIVLAAGNARHSHAHARRVVSKDRSVLLRFNAEAGDTTDTHVEIWYEPTDRATVQFRVRSPQRVWSPWLGSGAQGRELRLRDLVRDRDVVALLRHDPPVRQGDRALALLSLAPTLQPADVDAAAADAGVWEIEARLVLPPAEKDAADAQAEALPEVVLRAWIERDDPARDSPAKAPCFVDHFDGDDLDTMCSIATGKGTLRVAGFNRGTGEPAPYSSPGDADRPPHVMAACEDDEFTPSIAAAATRTGETLRMNGTSVAAPVMARRLFNLLLAPNKDGKPMTFSNEGLVEAAVKLAASGSDPNLRPMRKA